jgi:UDP-N-acetyl-D-mannosaminuronic acid dehydrogenase
VETDRTLPPGRTNLPPPGVAGAEALVVGLGFAGLTFACLLADAGVTTVGCDVNPEVVRSLGGGRPHLHEAGVGAILAREVGHHLHVGTEVPCPVPAVAVVAVSTNYDHAAGRADLGPLRAAVGAIARHLTPDTLTVIRSTVPVGTTRQVVLPLLRAATARPLVAFCPERTIQGQAMRELRQLPQIVGAIDPASLARAEALFHRLGVRTIAVSSPEAAELTKLINNAHTDLIYGFGNEVALIAEALRLDADEVIRAANLDYPRPDLSRPGFVGGGCLSKDPYLLIESCRAGGAFPAMVAAARQRNESMPVHVGRRVLGALEQQGRPAPERRVLIAGLAYKGQPETDDLRGAPVDPLVEALRGHAGALLGHDPLVAAPRIAALGLTPVGLEEGLRGADAALFLNNHPAYRELDAARLPALMRPAAVVFDAWGLFREQASALGELHYLVLGRG